MIFKKETQQQIVSELFEYARKLGNIQDKRINFIKLPSIINNLANRKQKGAHAAIKRA